MRTQYSISYSLFTNRCAKYVQESGEFMKNSNLDRRTKYSLRVIRAAMFELLETKSFDAVTVTDICAKADVNRGTFYKYYRDVYDLFEKTQDEFIDKLHTLFEETQTTGSEMPDFFTSVFRILSENKELVQVARNREFAEQFTKKLLVFVLPQINQLIANADPHASEEKIRFLSEYIMGGCTRVVAAWIGENMAVPADRMERYITEFIKKTLQIA